MSTKILTTINLHYYIYIIIISVIILLLISGFFSGSETALTAASRGKLHAQSEQGSYGAKQALKLTDKSEHLIGSLLLGNNLVNILATALTTNLFTQLFGHSGIAYATLVMTFLILIFAEILPKTYAIKNAETVAIKIATPIKILVYCLHPIVVAIQWVVHSILHFFGAQLINEINWTTIHEEIAGAIALCHIEGGFQKDDRDRLLGALELRDREVREIMLHRSDIEMVNAGDDLNKILRHCVESSHTRIPIYETETDNIIGILHVKDLLRTIEKTLRKNVCEKKYLFNLNIMDVAMRPYFIPETTTLDDQMRQFLRRHIHFALVVDEYGALQGLITLEDILEEIVGEISDEFDFKPNICHLNPVFINTFFNH